MKQVPQNLLQGQAGVYRIASLLCMRGLNPYFPAVDVGADLIVDSCKIQVKCAHLRLNSVYPNGAYWFKLSFPTVKQGKRVWKNRAFSDSCDFVVFWGIEHDKFWIVPSSKLDTKQCLTLCPDRVKPSIVDNLENRWDLIDEFLTPTINTDSATVIDIKEKQHA